MEVRCQPTPSRVKLGLLERRLTGGNQGPTAVVVNQDEIGITTPFRVLSVDDEVAGLVAAA